MTAFEEYMEPIRVKPKPKHEHSCLVRDDAECAATGCRCKCGEYFEFQHHTADEPELLYKQDFDGC